MAGKTRNMVFKFDGVNVSTQAFGREFIPLMANVYALVQACSDEEVRIVSIENNCIKFTLAATTLASSVLCLGVMDGVRDVVKYNAAAKAISATLKKHCATLEFSDSASGEVCFRLNGGKYTDATWTQWLGSESYPIPTSDHGIVYNINKVYGNAYSSSTFQDFQNEVLAAEDEYIQHVVAQLSLVEEY